MMETAGRAAGKAAINRAHSKRWRDRQIPETFSRALVACVCLSFAMKPLQNGIAVPDLRRHGDA
jgi:hypothetical protein